MVDLKSSTLDRNHTSPNSDCCRPQRPCSTHPSLTAPLSISVRLVLSLSSMHKISGNSNTGYIMHNIDPWNAFSSVAVYN